MKKRHARVEGGRAKQVACTVSAAALMLGVSEAATIGINFQCNYNGLTGSYSGSYVTASAFGISTNGWESLTQMGTGYNTAVVSPLMETIDTTTLGGGLNPLPNGSLIVTWSASSANVSGFGGYMAKPPHYTFGGNGYSPGEEQVYWGFLRDGVNFGPGSSGGDNNQPGWTVDITGLKSVFTNSPFVVEMIGAGDSISSLTNVFVIDATLSSTQSVIYPNLPPIANQGDTAWPRGIGGGLSTASGPVNTDHLQLMSNRAQHAAGSPGYNNAGEVAGFILTDKPVVTMSPQPVLAGPHDSVALSAYAIGVPPLAYQWRFNGAILPGATNSAYAISNLTANLAGNYDLVVTNSFGSTTSQVSTVTEDKLSLTFTNNLVADTNPTNAVRVGFNEGATWLASSSDGTTTRNGIMQFVALDTNQIVVVGSTNFNSASGTISFWMRSAGTDTSAPGSTGAALFGQAGAANGSDFIIVQDDSGNIYFNAPNANLSVNSLTSSATVSDNKWHLVTLTFDQSVSGSASLYIDGVLDTSSPNANSWGLPVGTPIQIGSSSDTAWRSYNGMLSDVRFYSRQLTATEVATVFSSGSLIDPANLQMDLSFSSPPGAGFTINWQLSGTVLQSANSVVGPYTDVPAAPSPYTVTSNNGQKFYRYRFTNQTWVSNPFLM